MLRQRFWIEQTIRTVVKSQDVHIQRRSNVKACRNERRAPTQHPACIRGLRPLETFAETAEDTVE